MRKIKQLSDINQAAVLLLRESLTVAEGEDSAEEWRESVLYRYKIPPKKPKISPVYPPAQRITVSLVIADIPPIIEMKNPAKSPSVVHSISETARKAAEACDFFT